MTIINIIFIIIILTIIFIIEPAVAQLRRDAHPKRDHPPAVSKDAAVRRHSAGASLATPVSQCATAGHRSRNAVVVVTSRHTTARRGHGRR
jgi:hypothetical protein